MHAEHLTHRVPGVTLVAVTDIVEEAARSCALEFGIAKVAKDPGEIFSDSEVDAVVICSSTDTHSEFIIGAAEAGKSIFCEKPIDFDLDRIDKALGAVERGGVNLQIGFNRRFDPSFLRARELIVGGKVGAIHQLRITSRDPAPPPLEYIKVSGGIFLDMMIHDFDMARYLTGSEVEEIFATGGVMIDPKIGEAGDIDTATVILKFTNGAIGVIENSRQAVYGYDQRIEVFGDKGMIEASNVSPNSVTVFSSDTLSADKPPYFFIERYAEAYINEMREFVTSVTKDKQPSVSGIDGRAPVVIGKAAGLSLQEKRPVRIEEIG